jgi:DNA-binding NarL/FixJ family response regulator
VRLRLATLLQEADLKVLPVASADEALEVLSAVAGIQVVVSDLDLPSAGMTGLELARRVKEEHGIEGVVLYGQAMLQDIQSGIFFLAEPLHPATLTLLVQRAMGSQAPPEQTTSQALLSAPDPGRYEALTPRQQAVLELLMQGKSNAEIAQALGLSANTVKVHLVLVFQKLGVSSRTEAALAGLKLLRRG